MNCPYCKNEMELGYIQSGKGVFWTAKQHFFKTSTYLSSSSVSLANGAAKDSCTVYAYKCNECKKVIIDYSNR